MASLYIKDNETAELAARVARRMGTTKTAAVRNALRKIDSELGPERARDTQTTMEWLREYRRKHPLPPPTGLKADKAFFDSLYEDDAAA